MTSKLFYLFVTIGLFLFSSNILAGDLTDKVNSKLKTYQTQLSLDKEQVKQLKPLMYKQLNFIEKLQKLTPGNDKWLETNRAVVSLHWQMDSVLTDGQRKAKQKLEYKRVINKKNGKNLYEIHAERNAALAQTEATDTIETDTLLYNPAPVSVNDSIQ